MTTATVKNRHHEGKRHVAPRICGLAGGNAGHFVAAVRKDQQQRGRADLLDGDRWQRREARRDR